uniref:Uncharacterized protein LOC114324390 n=1 Tax=Diabrotica virgifera virgifera TaxID=50390 RepID=A0A6P7EYF4_DIAVI
MAGYKKAYTIDEDNKCLQLITATKSYYYLRGRAVWQDLVTLGHFDECRTWMSLQNRFEKSILPNIMKRCYSISELEKQKIVLAWWQTGQDYDSDSDSDEDDSD